MSDQQKWQFHMRNFDNTEQWFGIYHAGCGGVPWHEGRPKCWDVRITNNPTGGENSVYVPANFVVEFSQWFKVIVDVLKEIENIGVAIASDGEDLSSVISGAFGVAKDVVEAEAHNIGADLNALSKNAAEAFEASCKSIGRSSDEVKTIAANMGLSQYGFLAGDAYLKAIHDNNDTINDGHGWTVLRAPSHKKVSQFANAAFVNQGHLVYYWNSNDLSGFWNDL
jgi:hypothetical protein